MYINTRNFKYELNNNHVWVWILAYGEENKSDFYKGNY